MVVGYLNTDDINGLQGRLAVFYLEISQLDTSLPLSFQTVLNWILDILIFTRCLSARTARERRTHCVRLLVERGASLEVKYFLLVNDNNNNICEIFSGTRLQYLDHLPLGLLC